MNVVVNSTAIVSLTFESFVLHSNLQSFAAILIKKLLDYAKISLKEKCTVAPNLRSDTNILTTIQII